MSKKCLYCYEPLVKDEIDFHATCSKKIFGHIHPPVVPFSETDMQQMANKVVNRLFIVTGVQPKLSLHLEEKHHKKSLPRFTIVGLWSDYIIKPPVDRYPNLPELEDATMHLAQLADIPTVPHSLIRLNNKKLAYITKRIDRNKKEKIHMEDMCQLTERLTEDKYRGSYEQIAKAIIQYTENPLIDVIHFFEQIIFAFLTGNADMHLKNFSLIQNTRGNYQLAPAYDMVATALVVKGDDEDLALTLNAKKKKIKRKDFEAALNLFNIAESAKHSMFQKFATAIPLWNKCIKKSFLPTTVKNDYQQLIKKRADRLDLYTR